MHFTDLRCSIQLLQRSAELLHPKALYVIGTYYQLGYALERNLDITVSHFQVASSRRQIYAMIELMQHYHRRNDKRSLLKYLEIADDKAMQRHYWVQCAQYAIEYGFEST